jgi:hypothetical protein
MRKTESRRRSYRRSALCSPMLIHSIQFRKKQTNSYGLFYGRIYNINMAKPRDKADVNTKDGGRYTEVSSHANFCYRTHNTHRTIQQSYT